MASTLKSPDRAVANADDSSRSVELSLGHDRRHVDRAAAADGPLVGAEVRGDDQRVVAHLGRSPDAMTVPASRQYTRSLIDMINGMSCSMIRIDASSSARIRRSSGPNASVSRCATPAVGSSRQSTLASSASRQASSAIRRVPVESSAMNDSPKRPSPRRSSRCVGVARSCASRRAARRASRAACATRTSAGALRARRAPSRAR